MQTELLGSLVAWPFRLPSLGKACVALMRIYGELERIARLPKCPGSLINSNPSVMVLTLPTFVLFRHSRSPRMMKRQGLVIIAGGLSGDRELTFGSDGLLLVGVVFFPSFSLVRVMLFPSYVQ